MPFGVQRVKSEGAFPGATDAREDDEPIPRKVEVDVAKVVFSGASNDDGAVVHGAAGCENY
jgi:hypothetical protein